MGNGNESAWPVPVAGGLTAYVDAEDAELAARYSWCMAGSGAKARPRARNAGGKVFLHRVVMRAPDGVLVDHINGDPLDCRKANLRFCTAAENAKNRKPNTSTSSRFKGVRWHADTGKWGAAIKSDGKQHWLGVFVDETDAAKAYDEAAIRLHGAFAKTNLEIFNGYR